MWFAFVAHIFLFSVFGQYWLEKCVHYKGLATVTWTGTVTLRSVEYLGFANT